MCGVKRAYAKRSKAAETLMRQAEKLGDALRLVFAQWLHTRNVKMEWVAPIKQYS